MKGIVTIKIYESSREMLRFISGVNNESIMDAVDRVLAAEKKKLEKKIVKKATAK